MLVLESLLGGRWVSGDGPGISLLNPTTEAVLATCDTHGLDLAAALEFARSQGGGALRALTFAERGALLEAASKTLHAEREALIELAVQNGGNTRGDAKFDIDGAIGTLMYYAELGKSLGDRRFALDGPVENIGKGGRVQGWHIRAPKQGVAVHINAFNFPAWGLAEKAACAWLAGMPVLTKPATSTALVAWHIVKALDQKASLPAGALSLLCGPVGDLLDHLGPQDVVAFTGSAETGAKIRGHQRVRSVGVAVNVEADSLNSSVLGAGADDASYDAFIRHLHTEMTQKAGQKCTATRRIFVPRDRQAEVISDLSERLRGVVVGDPSRDDVHVGPLATREQQRSAMEGIARLLEVTRPAFGTPGRGAPRGVEGERGFFVAPLLLTAEDARAAKVVHDLEVFAPLATVLPYDGTAKDAAALVSLGQGSLVASIYADDRDFLEQAVVELAPWHGRLVLTDGKIADRSMAPGMVLPGLNHGGPGRAGGGSELGGVRGLDVYTQRCVIQGNGPLIAKFLGASAGEG
ncbi:MAG: 3,4-dehydroadipyl-CoA semialdehyde dehydrogenase [Myxococcales bacterium]|nr:3,4-dehydroadipyl-CoA semialdehyde dehydrogenase [Myxococcales bacterium]